MTDQEWQVAFEAAPKSYEKWGHTDVALPEGWSTRFNNGVGYDVLNKEKNIVTQHPLRHNSLLSMIWHIYFSEYAKC